MTIIQAIILGIVQGLTEFLPVSSSAHLVIVSFLLRWSFPADQVFPFGVLVQLGTLLAVIVYFYKDLWNILKAFFTAIFKGKPFSDPQARLGWYLILATIPAGILGVLLKSKVESVFQSVTWTAAFLIVTAIFLFIGEKVGKRNRDLTSINWKDSLWIGLWQGISIFPGISRSGATITGGLTRNYDRTSAARFSFLMSIPVMLAAGAYSVKDLLHVSGLSAFLPKILVGTLVAAVVGFFAIHFFLKLIAKHSLLWFALYCAVFGLIVLVLSFFLPPLVQPASAVSTSQPQVVQVQSFASLRWIEPKLNKCSQTSNLSLTLREVSNSADLDKNAPYLIWGSQVPQNSVAVQVGTDSFTLIVNSANPASSLTLAEGQFLFSGSRQTWADGSSVHLFIFAPNDPLGSFFSSNLLNSSPASSFSKVVYDPASMLSAVSNDPSALGFLTTNSSDSSVKTIAISDVSTEQLTQPVLFVTPTEPVGSLKSFLVCLQGD